MLSRYGFWCHLTKNQYYQREQCTTDGDSRIPIQAHSDNGGNGSGVYIDQVIDDQDQPKEPIRATQQLGYLVCAPMALFCQMQQAVAVGGPQRRVCTGEGRRYHYHLNLGW